MSRRGDRARREDDQRPPPLPFVPGEVGNGEFVPRAPTARDRAIVSEALARAERGAARTNLDRRRFLQTTGGMAAMLAAVNLVDACGIDASAPPGTTASPSPTSSPSSSSSTAPPATAPGGTFEVPEPEDTEACDAVFGGTGEFIVDIHTHHVMPNGPWQQNAPDIAAMIRPLAPPSCTEGDPFLCLDRLSYVRDMLLGSETAVAMLSDVPSSGREQDSPVPFPDQVGTYDFAASLASGGQPRVLVQSILAPNFFSPVQLQDRMAEQVAGGKVTSFKVYTAWGPNGQGYALDDPVVGIPALEHAQRLGVKVIAAHKGLPIQGFDQRFNGPRDVVAAAKLFPDLQFIVFHSAFQRDMFEGPYDPARAQLGTNALLKAMDDEGMPPNSNVWTELGTTWREVMSSPTQAAHVLGKLLTRIGQDRVLWGTDAVWYGSPQPQIMAFRAFQIAPELQARFGYPALTPELKAKVFGLNAAQLLGLDPAAQRCAIDASRLGEGRAAFGALHASGDIAAPWQARAPITRRAMLTWLREPAATLAPF